MMLDQWLDRIPKLKKRWTRYQRFFTEIHVPAKTTLLKEGEISRRIFFVRKGSLRASVDNRGKDTTFQFFFEGDAVASIESFWTRQPSPMRISSIEPSTLGVLHKDGFDALVRDFPEINDLLLELAIRRLEQYAKLFFSYLKSTPRQRHLALMRENPNIIQRVPQYLIASYLGITPVSLSRIRRRT